MELSHSLRRLQKSLKSHLSHFQEQGDLHVVGLKEELAKWVPEIDEDKFVKAYLHDILQALQDALSSSIEDRKITSQLLESAVVYLDHLAHWQDSDNSTIGAIRDGSIPWHEIKPFVRDSQDWYAGFYAKQNEKCRLLMEADRLKIEEASRSNSQQYEIPLAFNPEKLRIQQWFRKKGVVSLVESLLPVLQQVLPETRLNWLDIGCGAGRLTNAVNLEHYELDRWQVIGCDLQKDRIIKANLMAAKNRRYFDSSVEALLESGRLNSNQIGLVSMFEFIEHLEDPLKVITGFSQMGLPAIVIGTPYKQRFGAPVCFHPDPVHLWGFSRKAVEKMFIKAGYQVFYSSVARIGAYHKGLNWLSMVALSPQVKCLVAEEFKA